MSGEPGDPPACRAVGDGVPGGLEGKVRAAALSRRFVILSRDPLVAVYLGERGDYVVVGGCYCSCEGYYRRLTRGEAGWCTHVYALREAVARGRYRDVSGLLSPGEKAWMVWEVLTGGVARGLRRVVARLGDDVGDDHGYGEGGGD